MGSQQMLFVALGVIMVGVAILVAVGIFQSNIVEHNKNSIINELQVLAQCAREHYVRPSPLDGGGNSYLNFHLPANLVRTQNARYACSISSQQIIFTAVSAFDSSNTVAVTLNASDNGADFIGNWQFTGDFQ